MHSNRVFPRISGQSLFMIIYVCDVCVCVCVCMCVCVSMRVCVNGFE